MNPIPLPSWFLRPRGDTDCRRRTTRIACAQRRCNLGEIIDLSATGARIACRRFFRPVEGKPITLTITPPGKKPLHIACVVCWARKNDRGWEAGLAFQGLGLNDARTLGDFAFRLNAGSRHAQSA